MTTNIPVNQIGATPPPHEVRDAHPLRFLVDRTVAAQIAEVSRAAVQGQIAPCDDRQTHYQQRAANLGYAFTNGFIYVRVLAQDVLTFYGLDFLRAVKATVDPAQQACWPARMVRPASPHLAPLSHVLFRVFLDSGPHPSVDPMSVERNGKPRRRDWTLIEKEAITTLDSLSKKYMKLQVQVSVTELVREAHISEVWRVHRDKVPGLAAWMDSFQASPLHRRGRGWKGWQSRTGSQPPGM